MIKYNKVEIKNKNRNRNRNRNGNGEGLKMFDTWETNITNLVIYTEYKYMWDLSLIYRIW